MTSHFLTFQVGVSSNYRKFNLEDLLGKNLKNCSAKLPSQFWFWWKLMKLIGWWIRILSHLTPFDPRMGSNRVVLGGQTQISLSNIDLLVKGSLCANFQTNLMRYNVLSHLTPHLTPFRGPNGLWDCTFSIFDFKIAHRMYKCVFGENLVKIAPQELLVAAEATPQSWQASQTSVWLVLKKNLTQSISFGVLQK